MDYHQNDRLWFISESNWPGKFCVSAKTAAKWVGRYRESGPAAMRDRSSRPHRLGQPTAAAQVKRVEMLRRHRWTGYGSRR